MLFLNSHKYSFAYVLCVSIVALIREQVMLSISPILILFVSSLVAVIYFHIINFNQIAIFYKKIFKIKWFFCILNLIVALMWFATYYSTYFSSATIFVYEFFITGACLALFAKKEKNLIQVISAFSFILLVCAPFLTYKKFWFGILIGILGGVLGFFYNLVSKSIAASVKMSASQILAVRFWLLIIITGPLSLHKVDELLDFRVFSLVIFIAFLSFVLQIWLNQKSVIIIGARKSSLIASFIPTLTFLMQGLIMDSWFFTILLLSVIGSSYVLYDYFVSSRFSDLAG